VKTTLLGISDLKALSSLLFSLSNTDSLGNSHANPLLHAAAAELVVFPPADTMEGDAARMTSLGGGEGDGGLDGLDAVVLGVLMAVLLVDAMMLALSVLVFTFGVDTESDELGTSDVASEELGFIIGIGQLAILGKFEGDMDGALLDVVGVNDVGFAGGQRGVKANASKVVSKRKLNGGGGFGHWDADDGVALPGEVGVNMMPGDEEEWQHQEEEGDESKLHGPNASVLGPCLANTAGLATGSTAEFAPEAAPLSGLADNEFDVFLVNGVDDLLLVLREL